jgi:hypothetical protein
VLDPETYDELTGYDEHLRDEGTHNDYIVEAYGDPCPRCQTLRFGGDCGPCWEPEEVAAYEAAWETK